MVLLKKTMWSSEQSADVLAEFILFFCFSSVSQGKTVLQLFCGRFYLWRVIFQWWRCWSAWILTQETEGGQTVHFY